MLKLLHVTLAAVSLLGFVARGVLALRGSGVLARRWVRVAPHVIDTLLLATGVIMAVRYSISPAAQPWLAAKLAAIVAYIVLGSLALKRARTPRGRAAAFAGALAMFGYVVAVALTRNPWPPSTS